MLQWIKNGLGAVFFILLAINLILWFNGASNYFSVNNLTEWLQRWSSWESFWNEDIMPNWSHFEEYAQLDISQISWDLFTHEILGYVFQPLMRLLFMPILVVFSPLLYLVHNFSLFAEIIMANFNGTPYYDLPSYPYEDITYWPDITPVIL